MKLVCVGIGSLFEKSSAKTFLAGVCAVFACNFHRIETVSVSMLVGK